VWNVPINSPIAGIREVWASANESAAVPRMSRLRIGCGRALASVLAGVG
jgi:hypothetical protein